MLTDLDGWMLGFTIIAGALAFTVTVFWIFVPFAIFGIKGLLRDQLYQQQLTNAMLSEIISGLRDGQWPEPRK